MTLRVVLCGVGRPLGGGAGPLFGVSLCVVSALIAVACVTRWLRVVAWLWLASIARTQSLLILAAVLGILQTPQGICRVEARGFTDCSACDDASGLCTIHS